MKHRTQMPTPVIGREGVEFIDDHRPQIAEPGLLIDACRDQHCFDPDLRVRDLFPAVWSCPRAQRVVIRYLHALVSFLQQR